MAIEKLITAIISASPAKRRKLEAVLIGKDEPKREKNMKLVSIAASARMTGLSRSTLYRLIDTNRLDVIELNGSRKITMESLTAFINGERPANEKTAAIIAERKPTSSTSRTKDEEGPFPFN